jgi:hypothetical protein
LKTDFKKMPNPGEPAILSLDWARALCHVVPPCHIVHEHPWFWT